jgi:hypothetical protein
VQTEPLAEIDRNDLDLLAVARQFNLIVPAPPK